MPGPASVRKRAASNELQMPEPQAKSSKEGESHNDDIIGIHADQDLEHDNAADKNFLDEIKCTLFAFTTYLQLPATGFVCVAVRAPI